MKKPFNRVLSFALSALLAASAGSVSLSVGAASEDDLGKVRVVVRNDTYTTENGAPWDGVLVDEWVSLNSDSDMLTALEDALNGNSYTMTTNDYGYGGYVSGINGLSEYDNGSESGWTVLLNDWYTSSGATAYNVAAGTLEAGDTISAEYTSNGYGADIGADYASYDTALKAISFDGAILQDKFSSSVTDYTLIIGTQTADVTVTPTAANKCFQVKTYKNTYAPSDSSVDYKRTESISVADGDKIIVGVADSAWSSSFYSYEGVVPESSTYTFAVKYVPEIRHAKEKVDETAANLSASNELAAGSEWTVLGLARADKLSAEAADSYCKSVEEYIEEIGSAQLSSSKSTDNSKFIIALTAVSKNAADFCGYDLTAPLADFDYVTQQGLNGAVYALIALDTAGYQIPQTDSQNLTTRDKLVNCILENQVVGGGWTYYGDTADSDMTAMAIQALAPYYNTNNEVKTAVDKALDILSDMQYDDGTIGSYGSNSCSTAQALAALASLGIDPTTDERFIKNGNCFVDGLLSFSVDGGFSSGYSGDVYDAYSTNQAFYALVSYLRVNTGKTSLYDMAEDVAAMYEVGDVDMSGKVDISDVTLVQKYIAKINTVSSAQCLIANANGDETVDISDATQIQKIIAHII